MNHFPEYEQEVLLEEEVDTADEKSLIVFNDEVNTFDHVIKALMEVCEHSPEQAEQCTIIIHHNGKCSVKQGGFELLKPMEKSILHRGISAQIL